MRSVPVPKGRPETSIGGVGVGVGVLVDVGVKVGVSVGVGVKVGVYVNVPVGVGVKVGVSVGVGGGVSDTGGGVVSSGDGVVGSGCGGGNSDASDVPSGVPSVSSVSSRAGVSVGIGVDVGGLTDDNVTIVGLDSELNVGDGHNLAIPSLGRSHSPRININKKTQINSITSRRIPNIAALERLGTNLCKKIWYFSRILRRLISSSMPSISINISGDVFIP